MSQAESPADEGSAVTCVGCRQDGRRSDLERFVHHEELGVVYDMRRGAPGDAAWLHPLPGCIRAACWSGFSRAFGRKVEGLDPEAFYEDLDEGLHRRLRERLNDAVRLGDAAVGAGAVEREAGNLELVVVDPDSESDLRAMRDATDGDGSVLFDDVRPGTVREALGGDVAAVGLPAGERADGIGRIVEKLICLHSNDPDPFDADA